MNKIKFFTFIAIILLLSACKNHNYIHKSGSSYSDNDLSSIREAREKGKKSVSIIMSVGDIERAKEKIENFGGRMIYQDKTLKYISAEIPIEYAESIPDIIEVKGLSLDKEILIKPMEEKLYFTGERIKEMRSECMENKCPFFPIHDLKIDSLKKMGASGEGVKVAVIDSGVSMDSKAFIGDRVKIINWQNFTSEGDLKIQKTDAIDNGILRGKYGLIKMGDIISDDGLYYVGSLEEVKLKENPFFEYFDFNNDGDSIDRFDAVILKKNGIYYAYFDTDDDADLTDEKAATDYNHSFLLLTVGTKKFPVIINTENGIPTSAHIGFDSIGHGTGISAVLGGKDPLNIGVDGVAPLSKIISIKVFSSKTTIDLINRGIIYAANNGADIVNISMAGLSGILESNKVTRGLIKDIGEKYNIFFVIAAGNDGPSIGSAVNSSTLPNTLFVGAFLSYLTYSQIYGGKRPDGYMILPMSSRGPSLDFNFAPDVVAPGLSLTISTSKKGEFMQMAGSSLSASMITGALSLILSRTSNFMKDSSRLKEAIFRSSRGIIGYQRNDQGSGAFDGDKTMTNLFSMELKNNINVIINSDEYLAKRGILLKGKIKDEYQVSALIEKSDENNCINGLFYLKSDVDWITIASENPINLSCDTPQKLTILVNRSILGAGMLEARIAGQSINNKFSFEIPVTVIIPINDNIPQGEISQSVVAGRLHRHFIDVKPNSKLLSLRVISASGEIETYIKSEGSVNHSAKVKNVEKLFINPEPGMWEIDIAGSPFFDTSKYNLTWEIE